VIKFWLVWNEQMGFPTHKHPTHEAAKAEAERLARCQQGHTFMLLELIGSCKRNDIVWTVPDGDDPIPF